MNAMRSPLRPFLLASLACVALLANPTPAEAQKPTAAHRPDWRRLWVPRPAAAARGVRAPLASARTVVTESEPNDSASLANSVVLGDTASGIIADTADIDYYALDLTAGTAIALDVQANRVGSPLDPILVLFDVDSTTMLASNDDISFPDILDSHIEFTIPATGRYFVAILSPFPGTGPGAFYSLSFGVSPPGPGDPTTLFSAAVGASWGMAAGSTGELYVADVTGSAVWRVSAAGTVSQFATLFSPVGVVIDGFGNLLVAGQDSALNLNVTRISPAGQKSVFAPTFGTVDFGIIVPITVGPNGDVWVGNNASTPAEIRHYAPSGSFIGAIPFDGVVLDLAFSPAGELYLTSGNAVNKIVNNAAQPVFNAPLVVDGLAFDLDGFLYVTSSGLGQVQLFDPAGVPVDTPFARTNLSGRIHLAFLRDANGAMTSRLLASNFVFDGVSFTGNIVEMNPAGVRAPGLRIGGDLLQIANTSLRAGVVGAAYADTLRIVAPPGAVTWSVVSGTLPPGITLAATTGVLSGIPAQDGAFPLTVRGDAASRSGFGTFTITVTEPTVVVQAVATHLLGGAPVDSVQQRFLDLQGNQNGKFDIGDFRAYLRAIGQLPLLQALIKKEQP